MVCYWLGVSLTEWPNCGLGIGGDAAEFSFHLLERRWRMNWLHCQLWACIDVNSTHHLECTKEKSKGAADEKYGDFTLPEMQWLLHEGIHYCRQTFQTLKQFK